MPRSLTRRVLLAAGLAASGTTRSRAAPLAWTTDRFDIPTADGGYRIQLLRPTAPPPAAGWPAIYLLDGNATFPPMEAALAGTPEQALVVVGVGYPVEGRFDVARRYYDLTPPTPADRIPLREKPPPRTGGRDAFFTFIEQRLKPEVARRVPIRENRQALFGHSLGGLFTLHVLFTAPQAFRSYIAADPSIWWNGHAVLDEQEAFLGQPASGPMPLRLLVETAGRKVYRPQLDSGQIARLEALRGGPDGAEVAATLARDPRVRVVYRHMPEESHGSMIPQAVTDALHFMLDDP